MEALFGKFFFLILGEFDLGLGFEADGEKIPHLVPNEAIESHIGLLINLCVE